MTKRVEFLAGADVDLQRTFNRFEDYRDGFGGEFMTTVDAYLARIAAFPKIAPLYFGDVRRQVIRRFPYGIFYVINSSRVLVLAILDLRRDERAILEDLRTHGT